jgi:hypothetical protein
MVTGNHGTEQKITVNIMATMLIISIDYKTGKKTAVSTPPDS